MHRGDKIYALVCIEIEIVLTRATKGLFSGDLGDFMSWVVLWIFSEIY
jgi:hypothetical protein